jgi:glycosyltransferase involved in cell wall biosynthesis
LSVKPVFLSLDRSEGFFPEALMQRHYAGADFVILPYTPDFDGSSAVLASACAHGKPVITTDHGIIGFRVRRHALGFVYPSGDTPALAAVVKRLPQPGGQPYRSLAGNCLRFAAANSIAAFQKAITLPLD